MQLDQLGGAWGKLKPRRLAGASIRIDGGCYILGLQVLPLASHTPPALVQSPFVFAAVTSAAKAGAVKTNASPKATIIETNLLMCIFLLRVTTLVVALKSYWFLGVIVLRLIGAVSKMIILSR